MTNLVMRVLTNQWAEARVVLLEDLVMYLAMSLMIFLVRQVEVGKVTEVLTYVTI